MGSENAGRWRERLRARRLVEVARRLSIGEGIGAALEWLDPFETQFKDIELAEMAEDQSKGGEAPDLPGAIKVMTWNIKFGGGRVDFWFDGHGDRVVLERHEVLEHLEGIAAAMRAIDPDIVLLQEVDIGSKRVGGVDQFRWLLEHTDFGYGAYGSQWRCRHVPTRGIGAVDMGVAILSKYPIVDARRIALPQIEDEARITRYFYLKRGMLSVRIEGSGGRGFRVVNIHTEPFARDRTKWRQLKAFKGELERLKGSAEPWVAGGDLNAIPPGSTGVHGFDDEAATAPEFEGSDFRGEEDWLSSFYRDYHAAVPLEIYENDNGPHLTHSSTGEVFWCRKLDYLFSDRSFVDGSTVTHQERSSGDVMTMELSDHAPISAVWKWE